MCPSLYLCWTKQINLYDTKLISTMSITVHLSHFLRSVPSKHMYLNCYPSKFLQDPSSNCCLLWSSEGSVNKISLEVGKKERGKAFWGNGGQDLNDSLICLSGRSQTQVPQRVQPFSDCFVCKQTQSSTSPSTALQWKCCSVTQGVEKQGVSAMGKKEDGKSKLIPIPSVRPVRKDLMAILKTGCDLINPSHMTQSVFNLHVCLSIHDWTCLLICTGIFIKKKVTWEFRDI